MIRVLGVMAGTGLGFYAWIKWLIRDYRRRM